jgi:hypothetical protein
MAEEHADDDVAAIIAELQNLLLATRNIEDLLQELAVLAARRVTGGLSCGITLQPNGRPLTVASSDMIAEQMDEVQCSTCQAACMSLFSRAQPRNARSRAAVHTAPAAIGPTIGAPAQPSVAAWLKPHTMLIRPPAASRLASGPARRPLANLAELRGLRKTMSEEAGAVQLAIGPLRKDHSQSLVCFSSFCRSGQRLFGPRRPTTWIQLRRFL